MVAVRRRRSHLTLSDVATVQRGPARGAAPSTRTGPRPSAASSSCATATTRWPPSGTCKEKIAEIAPGLPSKTLADGTVSQVTIVPFYDRTTLIHETLGTLNTALSLEILVTIIVVIVMVHALRRRDADLGRAAARRA